MRNKTVVMLSVVLSLYLSIAVGQSYAADAADKGPVAATVGDARITAAELNFIIKQQPNLATPEAKKNLISQIENGYLLAEKARKLGLADSPDYKTQLRLAEWQALAQMYAQTELKKQMDAITVSDEEAKKHYDERIADYSIEQYRAHHILIAPDKKKDADAIYAQLKKDPKKFEAIAKSKSTDPGSKDKGGDLGWFEKGRMVPEFENGLLKLKKGEIGPPVQSRFGWHIIRLDDQKSGAKTFDEVKETIRGNLESQKRREAFEKTIEDLKKEFPVKENADVIDKEVGRGMTPPPPAPPAPGGQ